jgi:hypothetical protein
LSAYGVNTGTAKFTFDLKQGNEVVTETFSTAIARQTDTTKMTPTTNGFVVHPGNPMSVGFIGGTAPYTSRLTYLAVQREDRTRGWTEVTSDTEINSIYQTNIVGPDNSNNQAGDYGRITDNLLTIASASRALYVTLEVTDSAGKKAEVTFYTMGRGTKRFTKTDSIDVGEQISYAFNTAELMGNAPLAYVRGYDNSKVGLVKRTTEGETTTYTFQGISPGTTKIVPWAVPPIDDTLTGEAAWSTQSFGVANLIVNPVTDCLIDITEDETVFTKDGQGMINVAFADQCLPDNISGDEFTKKLNVVANTPSVAVMADLKGARPNATNYPKYNPTTHDRYWVASVAVYGVNTGEASFGFNLQSDQTSMSKTLTKTITVAPADTTKMTPTVTGFVVYPNKPVSVGLIGGTAPYTFEVNNVYVQEANKTRSWTAKEERRNDSSIINRIVAGGNGLVVNPMSEILYVILEVTDSGGKKALVSFYNMLGGESIFTDTQEIAVGERVSFTDSEMDGNPITYIRNVDISKLGLVERATNAQGVTTYTFIGLQSGQTEIMPWSLPAIDNSLTGNDAWVNSYGVIAVTVTGGGGSDDELACGTNGFKHKFVPNAWNIKTNYFRPQASLNEIYDLFNTQTFGRYATRVFAYVTKGEPYQENPSLSAVPPGMGYWFNSGAQSPACVEGVALNAPTSGSVTLNKALSMVGNMTGTTKTWGDAKITVNGQIMSLIDASKQKTPIVKAIFTYTPNATGYTGYYAPAYSKYIAQGGQSIEAIASVPVAPGDGAWIALNSKITSATISF